MQSNSLYQIETNNNDDNYFGYLKGGSTASNRPGDPYFNHTLTTNIHTRIHTQKTTTKTNKNKETNKQTEYNK